MANRHLYLCRVVCSYVAIGRSEDYYISSNIDDPSHFDNQSNTTFYFSNGSHELNYRFFFKDVANISLVGTGGVKIKLYSLESTASDIYYEPFSRIVCTNPSSGFSFHNVTNVFIANITFANCGSNPAPIYFFSTYLFTIDIVSIQNATGHGILSNTTWLQYDSIIGPPLATITRSSFIIIDGTAISFNSFSQFIGYSSVGAITELIDCTFYNTTTAISTIGNIAFKCMQCTFENCATGINASLSDFTINNCKFDNVKLPTQFVSLFATIIDSRFNKYINAGFYTYSYVANENSNFSNSRRSSIYAHESYLTFLKNISFSNGYSIGYGGVLHLSASTIGFYAPARVSFINNTAWLGGRSYLQRKPKHQY